MGARFEHPPPPEGVSPVEWPAPSLVREVRPETRPQPDLRNTLLVLRNFHIGSWYFQRGDRVDRDHPAVKEALRQQPDWFASPDPKGD